MKALLWKDYRINRLVLFVGLILLLGPYGAACTANLVAKYRNGMPYWTWSSMLVGAGALSLFCTWITAAMLGGTAFACERAHRSAEFLAYLPPSRGRVIASKVIVALGAAAVLVLVNVLVIYGVASWIATDAAPSSENMAKFRETIVPLELAFVVLFFGASWLGSTFLPTHSVATGLAFGAPVAVFGVLRAIEFFFDVRDLAEDWVHESCVALGVFCFVAGIVYYLRRVEP